MHKVKLESGIKNEEKPTSKPMFKPSSWLAKVDYINHLVLFNNVLITLLAEQGGGKSTFIELLNEGLDSTIKSHVMKAVAPFSKANFLVELDSVFHFRVDIEMTLRSLVTQINERKAHVLIIVDDAQYLPDLFIEELLLELKNQGANGFFHVCLLSDFSMAATFTQLDSNLIHIIEPGILSESEMKTYLLSSLPSPTRLDRTMTDKRLEQFYQLTGGNIARINQQMIDFFCPSIYRPQSRKSRYFFNGLALLATAAIFLLGTNYFSKGQLIPFLPKLAKQEPIMVVEEPIKPIIAAMPVVKLIEKEPVLVSHLPDINYELARQPSRIPVWLAGATRQPLQSSPIRVTNLAVENEFDDSLVVRDRVVVIPKVIPLPVEKTVNKAKVELASSKPIEPAKTPSKSVTSQFTIQVLASPRKEDLNNFIKIHHLQQTAKIRLTKRNDHDWYILTIGEYTQLDLAQKAIKSLPTDIAKFKPWIRPSAQLTAIA